MSDRSERAILANLRPPPAPHGVPTARWRRGRGETGDGLSFHRGKHVGVLEAYESIVKEHPRVAKKILKAFNMDEEGSIGGEKP